MDGDVGALTAGMSQAQITSSVCRTCTVAGVQLVMIGEVHRLKRRSTTCAR
ncbi:hypothetical protein [Streptomyces formicae]|uniref:Uncharacterized protein n=1 Tax=Streptomyces formicae TaxID=1616117 RepID=A0ABY3WKN5_9ACTN|nr:hypothetical protein [Streptomyces formicae]UNM13183.1 hypothetical protein J4032_18305 [Streptomyces formicae]